MSTVRVSPLTVTLHNGVRGLEAARNHALACQERVSVLSWSGAARYSTATGCSSLEPPTAAQLHALCFPVTRSAPDARTVAGETPFPSCFVNSRSSNPPNYTAAKRLERVPFDRDLLPQLPSSHHLYLFTVLVLPVNFDLPYTLLQCADTSSL